MTATAPASTAAPPSLRSLLRDRSFTLYLTGQTTSKFGGVLSTIALVFAVLAISRSAGALGLVLLAGRLPGVGLALAGGLLADRCSPHRVALIADLTRTAVQVGTGALLLSGHATLMLLAVLQLIAGGASAAFGPAADALAASVAPGGQFRRAESLLSLTGAVAQTGALAAAGVIVAIAGPGTSFLIDGATFAVSSATIALVAASAGHRAAAAAVAPPPKAQARSLRADLMAAWTTFSQRGWLTTYALHITTLNVLALSPFFVLGPVIAERRLGGAPAWSAIAAGYVVGDFAAAWVSYRWSPARPILAAAIVSVGMAPLLALLALAAPLPLLVPAAFLAGAQATVYSTLATSARQANLPHALLGRVSAVTSLGSTVLVPPAMALAGLLADAVGPGAVLFGSAGAVVAASVAAASMRGARMPLALERPG